MKIRSFSLLGLCIGSLIVGASGCYDYEPPPQLVGEVKPAIVPAPVAVPRYRLMGRSVRGRAISALVLGRGEDTTVVMATIHGNEAAGTPLARELAVYLRSQERLLDGRQVVIMPVANPDGMASGTRGNARGVDLNRNFEAANRVNSVQNGAKALSEPEARAIDKMIHDFRPDRIISLHQPLSCIDYDGPAGALAKRLAEYCDLPVKKLGARPGSLGAYAGEKLGIPIITMELTPGDSAFGSPVLWQRYGRALIAGIVFPQRPGQGQ